MDLTDSQLPNDSRTKSFVSQIEKALKGFEYSTVWADLISNLGKLMRVLQSNSSQNFIPKKVLIAKRLAQCLHPALPSGVHLKTLECYRIIFSMIPINNLAQDMSLFGNGLFSLFNNSAMTVKPVLFDLIEDFLMPMKEMLKPSLPGLIQGLLPCLEDGSEFYDRGFNILKKISESVGRSFFFSTLWEVVILNPSVRLYAISFILASYNKKMPLPEQLFILGDDKNVLTTALSSLLEDNIVLVQRNSLDFLLTCLSMNKIEEIFDPTHITSLVQSSTMVLLQRDAYLNRRLISWYFGTQSVQSLETPSVSNEADLKASQEYFNLHTRSHLISALFNIIDDPNVLFSQFPLSCGKIPNNKPGSSSGTRKMNATEKEKTIFARLFRLFSSLLDSQEIGQSISKEIVLKMIEYCMVEYEKIIKVSKIAKPINKLALVNFDNGRKIKGLPESMESILKDYQIMKASVTDETTTRHFDKIIESQKSTKKVDEASSVLIEFTKTMNDFFSRLEAKFLWSYLANYLAILIDDTPPSVLLYTQVLEWSSKTIFLIKILPIEKDQNICSNYLPEMLITISKSIIFILNNLKEKATIENDPSFLLQEDGPMNCIKNLLAIYKFIIEIVIKLNICICDEPEEETIKTDKSENLNLGGISSQKLSMKLYTNIIRDLRSIFCLFVQVVLCLPKEKVEVLADSLNCGGNVLREYENIVKNKLDFFPHSNVNDSYVYNQWSCLLTEILRIILLMTEIPLVILKTSLYDRKYSFDDYSQDFVILNDYKYSQWIMNLAVMSIYTKNAKLKFTFASTFIDIVQTSLSVHGWEAVEQCETNLNEETPRNEMFMIMPVLGCKLLREILINTKIMSSLLLSLWDYLNGPETSSEDSICLLYRIFTLISSTRKSSKKSTIPLDEHLYRFEEFFVNRMNSLNNQIKLEAHINFKNIWELSRLVDVRKISKKNFTTQIIAESWQNEVLSINKFPSLGIKNYQKNNLSLNWLQSCSLLMLDALETVPPLIISDQEYLNDSCSSLKDSGRSSEADSSNMDYISSAISNLSKDWLLKSFDESQITRLLMPILASLFAPNSSRISLHLMNQSKEEWKIPSPAKILSASSSVRTSVDSIISTSSDDAEITEPERLKTVYAVNGNEQGSVLYLNKNERLDEAETKMTDYEENFFCALQSRINSYSNVGKLESDKISKLSCEYMNNLDNNLWIQKNNERLAKLLQGCVLPIHKNVLIYNQKVDMSQLIYSLKRIKYLLNVLGEKLIISLLNQTISSEKNDPNLILLNNKSFYGMTFLELFARHLSSINQRDFYTHFDSKSDAMKLISEYQFTNLFDVILIQLTWIISSYFPVVYTIDEKKNLVKYTIQELGQDLPDSEIYTSNIELKLCALELVRDLMDKSKNIIGELRIDPAEKMSLNTNPSLTEYLVKYPRIQYDLSRSIYKSSFIPVLLQVLGTETNLSQWPNLFLIKDLISPEIFNSMPISLRLEFANSLLPNESRFTFESQLIRQKINLLQEITLNLVESQTAMQWIQKKLVPPRESSRSLNLSKDNTWWNCGSKSRSLEDKAKTLEIMEAFPPFLKEYQSLIKVYLSEFRQPTNGFLTSQSLIFNSLQSIMDLPSDQIQSQDKTIPKLHPRLDIQISWLKLVERIIPRTNSSTLPVYVETVVLYMCQAINFMVTSSAKISTVIEQKTNFTELFIDVPNDYVTTILKILTNIYQSFLLQNEGSKFIAQELVKMIAIEKEISSQVSEATSQKPSTNDPQLWEIYSKHYQKNISKISTLDEVFKSSSLIDQKSNLIKSSISSTLYNWILIGRCQLFKNLPEVIESMAMLWDSLNFHTSLFVTPEGNNENSNHIAKNVMNATGESPDLTNIQFFLKYFKGFGKSNLMRPMIRGFLEPISLSHPSSFLVAMALAWPDSLLTKSFNVDSVDYVPPPSINLLDLLEPIDPEMNLIQQLKYNEYYPAGITLTGLQCSMLALMTGRITVTTLKNCLANTKSNRVEEIVFDPLIGPNEIVMNIKDLVKTVANTYPTVALITANSAQSTDIDINDYSSRINPSKVKINLMHILYSWIAISYQNLQSIGLSSSILLSFFKDVTTIDTSSGPIQMPNQILAQKPLGSFDDPSEDDNSNMSGEGKGKSSIVQQQNLMLNQTTLTPNNLPPVANFILVKIFNELLINWTNTDEKKELKDYQDICGRIMESLAQIASSAMEQPTWFRRNYIVKQTPVKSAFNTSSVSLSSSLDLSNSSDVKTNLPGDLTIQAFRMMSKHMIILFDVVYKSDEKEKISSILIGNIFPLIFPYLRVRYPSNMQHFDCASQLIASLSSYQCTRRAWRKDIFEIFMESHFFQMMPRTFISWLTIVDNLMTQDKNSFKEAMTRLIFSQTGALNLFTNKEAEDESRAAILKKLSFLVFSSDPDQYSRSMNDFLERLTDCIRSLNGTLIEQIHQQIFLFARVILVRIPACNLYSLWHLIISELVYVLNEFIINLRTILNRESEKITTEKLSNKVLKIVLSACKLIATALLLGEENAPQFSYNRWVFLSHSVWQTVNFDSVKLIGSESDTEKAEEAMKQPEYTPLFEEILTHLRQYCSNEFKSRHSKDPLPLPPYEACLAILSLKSIESPRPLLLFFASLSANTRDFKSEKTKNDYESCLIEASLEASILQEFPEPVT